MQALLDAAERALRMAGQEGYAEAVARGQVRAHLVILREPYLSRMLDGSKTVESRWAMNRRTPWQAVDPGDLLILKRSSGPAVAVVRVVAAWFKDLHATPLAQIRAQFGDRLGITDASFWETMGQRRYVSLMELSMPVLLEPAVPVERRGQNAWVVLRDLASRAPVLTARVLGPEIQADGTRFAPEVLKQLADQHPERWRIYQGALYGTFTGPELAVMPVGFVDADGQLNVNAFHLVMPPKSAD